MDKVKEGALHGSALLMCFALAMLVGFPLRFGVMPWEVM